MKIQGWINGLIVGAIGFFGYAAQAVEAEAVPGEYLVKLKPSISVRSINMLSQTLGTPVLRQIPNTNIVVVKRAAVEAQSSAIKSLSTHPMVDIVEPNYIYRTTRTPNDPKLSELWGLKNIGQADSSRAVGVAGVDVGAEEAWDIQTGSREVIVAVIDTGVDHTHPDLAENMWVNEAELNGKPGVDDDGNGYVDDIYGYDFVNNDGNPMDDHGHGSHCAGTIGAKGDDAKGIVGVAWNVRIMGLKFLSGSGSGTLENAIKSIDYATKMGAHIQSNSWGGGGYSELLKQSIERSHQANSLFIAAAGNHSANNDNEPSYPASYEVPNVVSVAAVNNKGQLASFSCYGKKSVHVGAPGVNVLSSIPGGYASWSGTSMATPHVSGVAALLLSNEPGLSNVEMKDRLIRTSKPMAGLKGKVKSGGMVNAFLALTNQVAPPDENDPENWTNVVEQQVSTPHPYPNNANLTFTVKVPGAKQMALFFAKFDTERSYDKVEFFNAAGTKLGEMSGANNETWSQVFETDEVELRFKSDGSVQKYGFDLTKAAWR